MASAAIATGSSASPAVYLNETASPAAAPGEREVGARRPVARTPAPRTPSDERHSDQRAHVGHRHARVGHRQEGERQQGRRHESLAHSPEPARGPVGRRHARHAERRGERARGDPDLGRVLVELLGDVPERQVEDEAERAVHRPQQRVDEYVYAAGFW